jgi:hypothetical protein
LVVVYGSFSRMIDGRHELVPGPVVYMPLGRSKDN